MKFYTYFSNQQRLAVVGLILVIVFLEVLSIFPKPNGYDGFQVDLESYLKFQNEITQQIVLNEIKSAPKIYPFNPNFITDYKGYKLGMNSKEINRLLLYRAQNKWINSAKEFQNVTKVSDSFLHIISLNFKFPNSKLSFIKRFLVLKSELNKLLLFSNNSLSIPIICVKL